MKKYLFTFLLFLICGCQYKIVNECEKNDTKIAGYKICVNDYCSGLFRTQELALKKLKKLQENIKPYPENLKYLEFTVVFYENN